MNHRERITEIQMALIMAGGFIELGLYSHPRHLLELAGRPFYLTLVASVLIGLLLSLLLTHVMLRYPGRSPIAVILEVLGRPVGTVVSVWFLFFHLTLAAICLRYFGDLINTYFLPRTPIEATMMLVILTVLFINAQGLAASARVVTGVFIPVTVMVVAAYLMTGFRASEWEALVPVFSPLSAGQFVQSITGVIYLFIGVESVAFLLPLVDKPKRPYFWATMPMLGNGLVLLIVLGVTLGVLGFEPAQALQYPGINTLRVLRLPGILVERLGGVVAIAWTALKIVYLCVRLLTISMALAPLFGLSVARYRPFLVPCAVIVFFLARWPNNVEEVSWIIQWWVGPVGLVTNGGLFLLLLLVGSLRGKGEAT